MRRVVALLALLLSAPFALPADAHPLDGPRLELCAPAGAVAGEPVPFFGRFTLADRPDSDHVGKLGLHAAVRILVDGKPLHGWAWYDGRFWGVAEFSTAGEHTLQAAWGPADEVRSRLLVVDVREGPPTTGLQVELACHLVYRDAGYAHVWSVVLGTAPAPADPKWEPVSGSVYVARPDSCWHAGFCQPTVDEQLWGFAAPVWSDPTGVTRRAGFAAAAGPFVYRSGTSILPHCSVAWWSEAEAYATVDGETLRATARDVYTGDEPPRVCG